MDYVKKLFRHKDPYDIENTADLFVKAMKQNVLFHYNRCNEYKKILDKFSFDPNKISSMKDVEKLPPIPTLYLKHHKLQTIKDKKMLIKATSSGTSEGNTSKVGLDLYSCFRELEMLNGMFKDRHLWSCRPHRYVSFAYEHKFKNKKAIAQSSWGFTFTSPAVSKDYAIRWKNGEYVPDLKNIENKLIKYSKKKTPIRTMGFPAYTYFLLRQMKEHNIKLTLPKGSILTMGGGWKQFYAEKVSKEDLYKLANEVLGIEEFNIIEFFSAAEHPILWTDCKYHHFHVPIYARVIIRDVDTLEPLPYGEMGLINLITPAVRGNPICSIMTDDLGILHDDKCPCGKKTPYLEIIGRVGLEDIKTCAAGADELLKGVKQ